MAFDGNIFQFLVAVLVAFYVTFIELSNGLVTPHHTQHETNQQLPSLLCEQELKNTRYPYSCRDRCGHMTPFNTDSVSACHCDPACWLYGDCCLDHYQVCLKININASNDKVLKATLGTFQNYSQVLQFHSDFHWSRLAQCWNFSSEISYLLVVTCSQQEEVLAQFDDIHTDLNDPLSDETKYFMGLSKEEIQQRCERKNQKRANEYLLDQTHVSLIRDSAVHFFNIFCAICNGVRPSHVTVWTTNITCDSHILNHSHPHSPVVENIQQEMATNKCKKNSLSIPSCLLRTCFLNQTITPKRKINRDVKNIPQNDEQNNKSVFKYNSSLYCIFSNLCDRYQFPYVDNTTNTVFKNKHCFVRSILSLAHLMNIVSFEQVKLKLDLSAKPAYAIENGFDSNDGVGLCCLNNNHALSNSKNSFGFQVYNGLLQSIPSIRVLFDFRSSVTMVTVNETIRTIEMKTCPKGQVYVTLYKSCRQVQCLPGTRWIGNQCLPVNECSEKNTITNDTCYENDSSYLDYNYPPFQGGSKFVRLNIYFDYLLSEDFLSHLLTFSNANMNEYIGDDLAVDNEIYETKHQSFGRVNTKNETSSQNNRTCLHSIDDIDNQLAVSSLRNTWIKQTITREANSTLSQQKRYYQMIKNIIRFVPLAVKEKLENPSSLDKIVFCDSLFCVTQNSSQSNESNKDQDNDYLYNQFIETRDKLFKIKQGNYSSKLYLSLLILLNNSSDDLDNILRSTNAMTNDILAILHDNNCIMSGLDITNKVQGTSTNALKETKTDFYIKRYDSFSNETSELCQSGEIILFEKKKVERNENGTHTVQFFGSQTNLNEFPFNVEIYAYPDTSKVGIQVNEANISWCQVNMSSFQCQSMQTILLKSSDVVTRNGTLLMNKDMLLFRLNNSFLQDMPNYVFEKDLVHSFESSYDGKEQNITVTKESYVRTRRGVLLCSNFSNIYESRNIIFRNESVQKFVPDSMLEIIVYLVASIVSITCLVCTLLVYALLPSLRNIPGKIVMSLSLALLFAQILFLFSQKPEGLVCQIYAAVHHAAWLTFFAWLTAMSVHLAYSIKLPSKSNINLDGCDVFRLLFLICWGVPCLIASLCFALFKTKLINIGYGQNGICWIGNLTTLLVVFDVPVFITFTVTPICAVIVMRAIRKSANFRNKTTVSRQHDRRHLFLSINLSLLMGFNWLFYLLAVEVNNTYIWTAHNITNGSQGLLIFLCFVARKSLMFRLARKLKLWKCPSRSDDNSSDGPETSGRNTSTTVT